MSRPWSDTENDLIVADYFAMLVRDLAGDPYNKAEHRRRLCAQIGRTEGSVEYKHQNISAVLKCLGEDWISGYKPAFNFQMSLVDAVARWKERGSDWLDAFPGPRTRMTEMAEATPIWIGPPPTLRNEPEPLELEQTIAIAAKFDVAARDERNRSLGRAGEELVLHHEQRSLRQAGRDDLAELVEWTADVKGDGAGYDIRSFEQDGRERLLEVKTTNGWERTPFHISRNELRVADENRDKWVLFRLHSFRRGPRAFELRPPLDTHLELTPTSFRAEVR